MSEVLCLWDPPALPWTIDIPHGSVRSDFWFGSSLFKPFWLKGTFTWFISHCVPLTGSENTQFLLHGKCYDIHAAFCIFCPFEFGRHFMPLWRSYVCSRRSKDKAFIDFLKPLHVKYCHKAIMLSGSKLPAHLAFFPDTKSC